MAKKTKRFLELEAQGLKAGLSTSAGPMARSPDLDRRQQLLEALIEEFAAGGIGDRSLREVAAAVGTSHRMLLHHSGLARICLWRSSRESSAARWADSPICHGSCEAFAAMWADLHRPELRNVERLFFECYARARRREAV